MPIGRDASPGRDDYSDVSALLAELNGCDAGTPEHARLRERIVTRCLPLADNIARRFAHRGEPVEDLVQVARVGLMNAVNRFDISAGTDFLSFAVPTIMGEVRRHFRDHGWAVRVPRRLKELHLRIGAATAELYQRIGHAPSATELAEYLGTDREIVVEGLLAGSTYNSLSIDDRRGGDDEAPTIGDKLGASDISLEQIDERETLRPLIAALPAREQQILRLRFFERQTQSQIAERLGMSQMHVSRLLSTTLALLRDQARK